MCIDLMDTTSVVVLLICYKMWAIPTGTSSVKKKISGKESQYLVSRLGNRFGSANRVESRFGA